MLSNCSKMSILGTGFEDVKFYGQWITLHDQSPNGPRLVTNASIAWYPAFITHVNMSSFFDVCNTSGTVSRLRYCGRSWGLKIDVKWNIVRLWKSYICSNRLDVSEANIIFKQFNRIRNHLFRCWIEIGWHSRSRLMGSDYFSIWKYFSYFRSNGATCEWQKQIL